MKHVVIPGALLGALLGVWVFAMGFTGWYKHPTMHHFFWVVIVIQIAVLSWSIARNARDGSGYPTRVAHGVGATVVAGLIVICNSLLFTTVAFPHYFEELRTMQIAMLREAGRNEAEIKTLVEQMAAIQTPFMQALFGFIGTVVTGIVLSLVISLVFRGEKKKEA